MSSFNSSSDSDSSDSLFGDPTNPYNAVDCLGLKQPTKLTDFELKIRNTFTFDKNKYREFSDLRIYTIQSRSRYHELNNVLKFPNITFYNSTQYRAEKFFQRRICKNLC